MIYHITLPALWQRAQENGFYLPEEFEKDGFIHCSKEEQIVDVANRYYAGQTGHIVLRIDTEKLTSILVYENLIGGSDLFPHIYGKLALSAVDAIAPLEQNQNGDFVFPTHWQTVSR